MLMKFFMSMIPIKSISLVRKKIILLKDKSTGKRTNERDKLCSDYRELIDRTIWMRKSKWNVYHVNKEMKHVNMQMLNSVSEKEVITYWNVMV